MAPNVTRILVPIDFSETADAALAYAEALACRLGASLHLLHVFTNPYGVAPYTPDLYAPVPRQLRERALKEVRESLDQRLKALEATGLEGSGNIVTGLIAKEIARYATDHAIDLIIMGTHGRRGVVHLLLGSVAEHIVRTAPCPVLTVRDVPGAERERPASAMPDGTKVA